MNMIAQALAYPSVTEVTETITDAASGAMQALVWLNVAEAANYLRVSQVFLNKARCYGDGPRFSKIRKRVIYNRADLDAWSLARSRTSTSDDGNDDPEAKKLAG